MRQRVFTGSPWEEKAGYCRAMRIGNQIFVAGTAPSDGEGGTFAPGDAYAQTKRCFEIIQKALQDLGGDLPDIVRTRLFVTDMSRWEEFAQAHQELFADYPPVNTMVEIPGLVNPDMLVEVEVEALLDDDEPQPMLNLARRDEAPMQQGISPSPGGMPRRPIASNRSPADMDVGYLD
ncbi:RidA family protein [Pseudanabaena sp. FACHB-2040]|uniref:RidA family protein n=1 Tax=Pseudanabaena sp. FACHB-2040 TaxID=2692859 RepID=UPI001687C87F|nr:RidA family protein [Pseudanabaena sp. FACHB-2040]MBD0269705.1 RidA family protein [Cyanobacteria bacterium Co-bin8]MBD2260613.1 RidA family protein [Pseudanabaena sp. FACHB-2040]